MSEKNPNRAVINWLLSGCFLVYLMVVVGCLTRLTHSGLSITDWNFMGSLPPLNAQDWAERFAKYQTSPEFVNINYAMGIEEFKSIFWWEYIHRSIGNTMMGVFLLGFIWFLIKKKFSKKTIPKMIALFLLGALQGLIGWWMVKSGLVKNPAVSHYRLAIHLMSAFTVFAFTFWYALQLMNEPVIPENKNRAGHKKLRPYVVSMLLILIAQIIFGAFVAGLKAGLRFPTWPKMGNDWFPTEAIVQTDSWITNFFDLPDGVQFVHRTFAYLVVACVIVLWIRSSKMQISKSVYRGISFLIYGTTIQFILGIFTLIYHVPVVFGVLHQTMAFFLFASCVYLLYHVTRKIPVTEEQAATEIPIN
ncbi:MAG: COX15/CtaA family protein [Bacteroidia bacterium]|nr:COX15/CtaA family protein [Bacteroidia bacterium]